MILFSCNTTDILEQTKNDISQIFLEYVRILFFQFYDAVNMVHDVIRTANPFPYTAYFKFVGVINNKNQQITR